MLNDSGICCYGGDETIDMLVYAVDSFDVCGASSYDSEREDLSAIL